MTGKPGGPTRTTLWSSGARGAAGWYCCSLFINMNQKCCNTGFYRAGGPITYYKIGSRAAVICDPRRKLSESRLLLHASHDGKPDDIGNACNVDLLKAVHRKVTIIPKSKLINPTPHKGGTTCEITESALATHATPGTTSTLCSRWMSR